MQRRSRSLIALFSVPIAAALVLGVGAATRPEAAEEPAITLEASLSEKTLTMRRYGEVVKTYTVAVGTSTHPTPKGSYGVRKLVWNPGWVPPDERWARNKSPKAPGQKGNPMKMVKIFFREPDYYIHGTGDLKSLGTAASHGCIRMDPDEAAEVALAVMENGGVARDWDWVKSILNIGEARTVRLNAAAPLTITE